MPIHDSFAPAIGIKLPRKSFYKILKREVQGGVGFTIPAARNSNNSKYPR
jgi:hypothetical protein